MKKYLVQIEQNGGEYHGYTTFKCNSLIQQDSRKLTVDGIEVEFDERIERIKEITLEEDARSEW